MKRTLTAKWVYITFREEIDAEKALSFAKHHNNESILVIRPAHSWKQPSTIESRRELTEHAETLLALSEECALALFGYYDLYTRAKLWHATPQMREFVESLHATLDFTIMELNFDRSIEGSLRQLHTTLRCIGSRVEELNVRGPDDTYEISAAAIYQYVHQCSKYLSALKRLSITHLAVEIFSDTYANCIQPLLDRIETLTMHFRSRADLEQPFNFQLINIKELSLNVDARGDIDATNILDRRYQHLETVDIGFFLSAENLVALLEKNGQIKRLYIANFNNMDEAIDAIAKHALHLEELDISCQYFETLDIFLRLRANTELTKLKLTVNYLHPKFGMASMPTIVRFLSQLRQIRIMDLDIGRAGYIASYLSPMVDTLAELKCFRSTFLWDTKTMIEYIRNAPDLEKFCVKKFSEPITMLQINQIIDIRRKIFTYRCPTVLELFIDDNHWDERNVSIQSINKNIWTNNDTIFSLLRRFNWMQKCENM